MFKKLILAAFVAIALLAVAPSQAKAQTIVPDPNACVYTGCDTGISGTCYIIMVPCSQLPADWMQIFDINLYPMLNWYFWNFGTIEGWSYWIL